MQCKKSLLTAERNLKQGKTLSYNTPLDDHKNRMCLKKYKLPQKFKYDRKCCLHAEWRAIVEALKKNPEKING